MVGEKFGELTIIRSPFNFKGKKYIEVQCSCGKKYKMQLASIFRKRKYEKCRSCAGKVKCFLTKHGYCPTGKKDSLYIKWVAMRGICNNPNNKDYIGNKGIKVYEGWNDFVDFRNWALNNGYEQGLKLIRIDSSKDFSPENCKWIKLFKHNKHYTISNVVYTLDEAYKKFESKIPMKIVKKKNKKGVGNSSGNTSSKKQFFT